MSANDELQAHTCEKMSEFYGNVANNVAQRNSQDLTEQWKKGELKRAKYWVKYRNGNIDIWELSDGITIESKPEIIEVLAPVPSYEEWVELGNKYDSLQEQIFAQAPIHLENQQLKEIIKECREVLKISIYGSLNELTTSRYGANYLLPKIEEVLK